MRLSLLLSLATLAAAQEAPRPNIVVVMVDDMGWSDVGCFGSEIETPNLDRLAANGLRLTQFYSTGRCCPTRASLLTGLYAHQAGIGHMTSEDTKQSSDLGYPSYRGYLSPATATLAEVLGGAGYRTLMAGKWHVGTFEGMWPTDRGFDRFWGIARGATNFWRPAPDKLLLDQATPIVPRPPWVPMTAPMWPTRYSRPSSSRAGNSGTPESTRKHLKPSTPASHSGCTTPRRRARAAASGSAASKRAQHPHSCTP